MPDSLRFAKGHRPRPCFWVSSFVSVQHRVDASNPHTRSNPLSNPGPKLRRIRKVDNSQRKILHQNGFSLEYLLSYSLFIKTSSTRSKLSFLPRERLASTMRPLVPCTSDKELFPADGKITTMVPPLSCSGSVCRLSLGGVG
jgi:hypothetical protein